MTCSARLMVQPSVQPLFTRKLEDVDVVEGRTARFDCMIKGKPLPDIMWYKDGELLEESSHLSFVYEDNECSLVVLGAAEPDSGVYTCTAKNLAGEVSCKAELAVRAGTGGLLLPAEGDGEEQPSGLCRQVCPWEDQGQAVSAAGAAHPLAAGSRAHRLLPRRLREEECCHHGHGAVSSECCPGSM
uniref:Ig-like domain-containing protein n=1 Tax=Amazona collaria TaxID=241587 RepID=A0A8B9FGP2_9PSIT